MYGSQVLCEGLSLQRSDIISTIDTTDTNTWYLMYNINTIFNSFVTFGSCKVGDTKMS